MKKNYDVALRGHHLRLVYSFYFLGNKGIIWNVANTEHGKKHADNAIETLERIASSNVRVKIIDTIDDICETCKEKRTKKCKEFIPYGESAAASDRGAIYLYKLRCNRPYTSKFLLKRLKKMGPQILYI